jgi:signal transduction histidine kinase
MERGREEVMLEGLFPGESELAGRMRALDWSRTDLGPPQHWPQNLRIAVSLCLTSRIPVVVYWGPAHTVLYNDPYISFLGAGKHPRFLGRPGRECWSEIWDTIGPMLEGVRYTGTATWSKDLQMFFARALKLEEVFVRFSFGPILGPDGRSVDGIFCPCTETTEQVVLARRLETLRRLSARPSDARTVEAACDAMADVLADNPQDVPFAAIYRADDDASRATLAASAHVDRDGGLLPAVVSLTDDSSSPWPFTAAARTMQPQDLRDPARLGAPLPGGPYPEAASQALVLPIPAPGGSRLAGLLVAGVSPRRLLDDAYRNFLDMAAGHVATAIAEARAYDSERRRAESLSELDRAKTAFFSNVSHEFRTPLTLMLGPVDDLLARSYTELSPATKGDLEIVSRNGLRLLRLVNTLLDFSRIEAGRVQAVYEPTDLPEVTAELASVFRAACEKAGLTLEVTCPALSQAVYVDRDMWEKIVLNLLSNAFKFTFEGSIGVALAEMEGCACLTVRDTGAGIPDEEVPRLFERFHRVENARGRTHEGTGIGLALTQELVKLHGGTIRVESRLGSGSAFHVTIPLGCAHLPADRIGGHRTLASTSTDARAFVEEALRWLPESDTEPATTDPFAFPETERPRILVADDNADMRAYVARLLSERFAVETAADGAIALAAAKRRRPDLVLTDVMMPQLDGFGLLRELRLDPATAQVPVIMLSARAGEESRVEGMEAGADDYLIKPFSARELLARVGAHLQMARLRKQFVSELEEADRRKDAFLATLSHELRGPLAPLGNTLEILKRAGGDGELLREARGTMERQLSQLVRLVDDLLDVNRITRNRLELKRERVDLGAIVGRSVEAARPLAERYGHDLVLSLPERPLAVRGDAARLAQVLDNLLDNACKYTDPPGRIEVSLRTEGGEAVVAVKDSGLGIPPDKLATVFEMFAQVERTLDRAEGGLGLGLTLVKRLVEMHGGTVEAFSEGPGRGSRFQICLPVLDASESSEPRARAKRAIDVRRILVVDDNPDSASSLAMLLGISGYQTSIAKDGLEAVLTAESFQPDVVLLDLGLPKLSGVDAARRIREQPWGKEMLLIALTGWGQDDDRKRSKDAGFDAHVVKPVDHDTLMDVIAHLPPEDHRIKERA